MDKNIFISYCWRNEAEIDEIDNSFLQDDVTLIRDKRATEYKDSFKEFMKKIRKTDYVLMVISDEYLKSKNCMFEVLEVLKDENYHKRIFPIVLDNGSNIYSSAGPLEYLKFWNNEYDILKNELSKYSPEEVISVTEDLRIIRNIKSSIIDFVNLISDLKNIPFNELRQNNFAEIKQKLGLNFKKSSKIRYDILKQGDVSHAGAKRYSANVLIDSKYSRDEVKSVIEEVTESLINSNYYKNDKLKNHFSNKKADVVWLFVANRLSDVNNANWICRTSWINSNLDENMRPTDMQGNDSIEDIKIEWNDKYDEMATFYDSQFITKDEFLKIIDKLISQTKNVVSPLIETFKKGLQNGNGFESTINYTKQNQDKIDDINDATNNILMPPHDCKKLDELTQSYFATGHNLFLYYSEKGLETWENRNRIYLMQQDILRLQELETKIATERSGI